MAEDTADGGIPSRELVDPSYIASEVPAIKFLEAKSRLKTVQEFDLGSQFAADKTASGEIVFPEAAPNLSFNAERLLIGVLAGDFENGQVNIKYPHELDSSAYVQEITSLKTDLPGAINILRKCNESLGLTDKDIVDITFEFGSELHRDYDSQAGVWRSIRKELMTKKTT